MFQGIQAVALPLVQEFGVTREIEDRVLAPLPVGLVAFEKVVAGALQGLLAALIVFPIAAVVPVDPVHLHITGRCCSRWRRSPRCACSSLGLFFGTKFDPRIVPMLFGIIVLPLTFLGCTYYSWTSLEPDQDRRLHLAADARARQPARLRERGLPGRGHHQRPHEPAGDLPGPDRLHRASLWQGIGGFKRRVLS